METTPASSRQRRLVPALAAVAVGLALIAYVPPVAQAATVTPLLNVNFSGSFDGSGTYSQGTGETVAGTLTGLGAANLAGGVVTVDGGLDGIRFSPTAVLGSGGRVTKSVAVEAMVQRSGTADYYRDTVLAVAGGIDYRLVDAQGTWRYDMYGPGNQVMVNQSAAAPSADQMQHVGLVYTYVNSTQARLDLYLDGCRAGTTLTNASSAHFVTNALTFGNEAHPGGTNRGFHGTIDAAAAATFTGTFNSTTDFQIAAGRECEPSILPGKLIPVSSTDPTSTIEAKAAAVRPSDEQLAWQEMKTTAFVHFNMPTYLNVEGGDGRALATTFDPTTVDTDQWATVLKDNGYKMAILTVKHADGFLLYPSAHSDYDVMTSAYQQDVVRQFVDSMRAQDIKVGFYFSPVNRHEMNVVPSDWNADYPRYGYSAIKGNQSCSVPEVPTPGKPSFEFNTDEYNCLYMRELYEIFSSYEDIDEWWIDGNATSYTPGSSHWDGFSPWPTATGNPTQRYDNAYWYQVVRALQPDMLFFAGWDIRWVGNEDGFGRVGGEWSHVAISNDPTGQLPSLNPGGNPGDRSTWPGASNLMWLPTEVDVPISAQGNWFYHVGDTPKSLTKLWQIYAASVGRNATLLLDFAPDPTGVIPAAQAGRAAELKAKIDTVFGNDLAEGCAPQVSDNHYTFTCTFPGSRTINWVGLQEDTAQYGQRVESFVLEAWQGSSWQPLTTTTWNNAGTEIADQTARIGFQRLLHLSEPVTTTAIRVRVTASRQEPHLLSMTAHFE